MKYTAKITNEQYIRVSEKKKINISPTGGELSADEAKQIYATPYGKRLVDDKILSIEGFNPAPAPASQPAAPATPAAAKPAAPAHGSNAGAGSGAAQ